MATEEHAVAQIFDVLLADWLGAVDRYGLPLVALMFTWWMLWSAGRWVARHVLIPLRDQHIEFLNTISEATITNSRTLQTMAVAGEKMISVQSTQTHLLQSNTEALAEIRRALKYHHSGNSVPSDEDEKELRGDVE